VLGCAKVSHEESGERVTAFDLARIEAEMRAVGE
jgi:hypothetical protein